MSLDEYTKNLIKDIVASDKLVKICGESGLFMYGDRKCYLMGIEPKKLSVK